MSRSKLILKLAGGGKFNGGSAAKRFSPDDASSRNIATGGKQNLEGREFILILFSSGSHGNFQ
jgi:hypothetical protein